VLRECPSPCSLLFSGGNTACLGLLPDGTLLKYVRDRDDHRALNGLNVEHCILSALGQHDRIVKYLGKHDFGILLQLAPNGDIYSYISARDNISLRQRQSWVIQAAEALVFIHSKGVIHCDIHPNNFILDEELNLRLCDFAGSLFGILDGGAMESVRFFLPRDWRDPPNARTDIFALGSVMYYIITGRQPYDNLPDDEVVAKYTQKDFPEVESIPCGNAIKECWKGDFRSAEDVLKAILEDIE